MTSNSMHMLNRGSKSSNSYETLHIGVIWNLHTSEQGHLGEIGKDAKDPGIHISPVRTGWALVVGVHGGQTVFQNSTRDSNGRFEEGTAVNTEASFVGGAHNNVVFECIPCAGLTPHSLFDALLELRQGNQQLTWLDYD
jgi:hypothetical protein